MVSLLVRKLLADLCLLVSLLAVFLGRDGSPSWVAVWYPIPVQALADTKHQFPNRKPDFLVTEVGSDSNRPVFLAPMSRNRGVKWLRSLVRSHLESVGQDVTFNDTTLVGVHSAKTTMLSRARQLGLLEESRRLQGHHRAKPAGQSIQLYARDDVFPALELQRTVAKCNGSAPPIIDATVHIPPWVSQPDDIEGDPLTPATVIDAMAVTSDVDTSSCSTISIRKQLNIGFSMQVHRLSILPSPAQRMILYAHALMRLWVASRQLVGSGQLLWIRLYA